MSNICAGIGRGQMEVLDNHVEKRRAMHEFYVALFSEKDAISVFSEPDANFYSNHWLTAITIDSNKHGKTREDMRLLLEKYTIESRPLWKPMHLQPIFQSAPYYGGTIAENLFEVGLCLPSGSNLSNEDRERIKISLNEF